MTSSGAVAEEAPAVAQPPSSQPQPDAAATAAATEPVTPTTSAGSGNRNGRSPPSADEKEDEEEEVEDEEGRPDGENKANKRMLEGKQQRTRGKELPEEYLNGQWDAEPFYYTAAQSATISTRNSNSSTSVNDGGEATKRRQKRGVIYKRRENLEYECFQSHEGVVYRPGDQVFVESSKEEAWMIGAVVSFKMKKRDQLLVKLLRYYRPPDVPELSFSLITQDRIDEGHFHATRQSHARELFSSDSALLFHVAALRGKCTVKLVKDLRSALAEVDLADPDSFFHCLNYNQESGRLASVQMSIRVGSAHQADVPSCSTASISDEPDRDELLYRPGYLCAEVEHKYVKLARAFRTFSLMNNKRITTLEKGARTGDLLFDDAITTLHRCKYNFVNGLQEMQGNDQHLTSDSSFMSADDVKKFGKGIKTYGKAFNKINRELLPHHRREQLVAFYYLWKKSRDATRPKPLSNAMKRNQVALIAASAAATAARRLKNGGAENGIVASGTTATTPEDITSAANGLNNSARGATDGAWPSDVSNGGLAAMESLNATSLEDLMDYASASETETEQMENAEASSRACHHCFGLKSKDWHHVGHERLLMCTECRLFYKKYGQLRPVDRPRTVPPCLLSSTPVRTTTTSPNGDDENEEPLPQALLTSRIRTRGAGRQLLLQREQQRSRRTPSSLDGDRPTRRTPQRAITACAGNDGIVATSGTESGVTPEQLQRRSTPMRNAAKSRKRAYQEETATTDSGTDQTPTPASRDAKRHKKDNSALPSAASSRTPSPPQQQQQQQQDDAVVAEEDKEIKNDNTTSVGAEPSSPAVEEDAAVERSLLLQRPDADENGTITPPTTTGAATTDKEEPPTNSLSRLSEVNSPTPSSSAANSPNEEQQQHQQQQQMEQEPPQNSPQNAFNLEDKTPSSAMATSKISAPLALMKKPVAKVEPLDNTKKLGEDNEGGGRGGGGGDEQEEVHPSNESCCPATAEEQEEEEEEEDTTAVLEVEEDGVGQDMGPIGEPDETVVYRTLKKEGEEEGKVTVLQCRLRRSNGLSCARTDIAFIEVPERQRWREERKNREASERAARKNGTVIGAGTMSAAEQKQQQMNNSNNTNHQKQLGAVAGGVAKKMEMPSEFLSNGMPSDAPHPPALAPPLMTSPAIAMMNGLFVPPPSHPSFVPNNAAASNPSSSCNTTAGSSSGSSNHLSNGTLVSSAFAGPRLPTGGGYAPSQQQQQHQQFLGAHQQQIPPGMAALLQQQQQQQQQQQHDQQQAALAAVAAMQIAAMGGGSGVTNPQQQQQQLHMLMGLAQQQPHPQQQQQYQQLQQMLVHMAMQEQQQQKMMELQRQQQHQQQQQQKRSNAGQQQQQQQHQLLNGQHPHSLGNHSHAAILQQQQQQQQQQHGGHVFPNGLNVAQSTAHQQQSQQQQKEQLQQQQNHPNAQQFQQQQNAALATLMGQLFGAATHQQQQQQAAMLALQQRAPPTAVQQQAPPPTLQPNSSQHIGAGPAPSGPNMAQQQQHAMMLLEMAAAAAMNPQQLMSLMAGSGLDARTLDELRGHLVSQQQAAAQQHQQQQQQVQQQQQQQHAVQQQQHMLAMLAASGALTPEQLQMAVIGQQSHQQQNQQNSGPPPSTSSVQQQQQHQHHQLQHQQQMATLAAMQQQQQQQQQAAAVAAQQHHQQQHYIQQVEMLRRMQHHQQQQQQQQQQEQQQQQR